MYISEIHIRNFRNFEEIKIEFNENLNVIVGHNNAGKTNLLKALGLVFSRDSRKRLDVDDFYKGINSFDSPPKIFISVIIEESVKNPDNEFKDDHNIVYNWHTTSITVTPYKAQLTYEFFLPDKEIQEYKRRITRLEKDKPPTNADYWRMIRKYFIQKYVSRIYGGDPKLKNKAEPEFLEKFDFQFLDAIRDVEKQMFLGRNPMLKEILNYFLDFGIKNDQSKNSLEREDAIEDEEKQFFDDSVELISTLKKRIDTNAILKYSQSTGAAKGGIPDFDAEITEEELLSALRLVIEKNTGIKIPATHNGLGYNNLMFMALVLANIQMDCSSYKGENAKVFPMLVVEEPEAHLHPAMQFKLLEFIQQNIKHEKQVRQVFFTTHSTHITAAVDLDSLICLYEDDRKTLRVAHPGRVFNEKISEDKESKAYIKRFLDATKSNMLFSDRVIFVEGLAEQLLLPCFAKYVNKSITENHISIVNVGGRSFKRFLKLFDYDANDNFKKYAIERKVACICDADPSKQLKTEEEKFKKCYPFEINSEDDQYNYKPTSDVIKNIEDSYGNNPQIAICFNNTGKGKTLEYDLAFCNPECKLLLADLDYKFRTKIESLMNAYSTEGLERLKEILKSKEINEEIEKCNWADNTEKKKALIAATYYNAVESKKGEYALELEYRLTENLSTKKENFVIPDYIKRAIDFVCS